MPILGAFPVIKLAILAVRQISKPIAAVIKRSAKSHPFFKRYLCMPPAQLYHWLDVRIRVRVLGLGRTKEVAPLSEENAVDLGSEMLGELIIYGIAAITIYYEYQRQSAKEERREHVQEERIKILEIQLEELKTNVKKQNTELTNIKCYMNDIKTKLK